MLNESNANHFFNRVSVDDCVNVKCDIHHSTNLCLDSRQVVILLNLERRLDDQKIVESKQL